MLIRQSTLLIPLLLLAACAPPAPESSREPASSPPTKSASPSPAKPAALVVTPTPLPTATPVALTIELDEENEGQLAPVGFPASDPAMLAAKERAQATVADFVDAFENPALGYCCFSIKHPFVDGEQVEHMWVAVTRVRDDGTYVGTVANAPVYVSTPAEGQEVEIPPDSISDWMYVDNGVLRGGFTTRALYESLDPEQKRRFREEVPFRLEE